MMTKLAATSVPSADGLAITSVPPPLMVGWPVKVFGPLRVYVPVPIFVKVPLPLMTPE